MNSTGCVSYGMQRACSEDVARKKNGGPKTPALTIVQMFCVPEQRCAAQRPVRDNDSTQPSMRDFIFEIWSLSKKFSGLTLSTAYTGRWKSCS